MRPEVRKSNAHPKALAPFERLLAWLLLLRLRAAKSSPMITSTPIAAGSMEAPTGLPASSLALAWLDRLACGRDLGTGSSSLFPQRPPIG